MQYACLAIQYFDESVAQPTVQTTGLYTDWFDVSPVMLTEPMKF